MRVDGVVIWHLRHFQRLNGVGTISCFLEVPSHVGILLAELLELSVGDGLVVTIFSKRSEYIASGDFLLVDGRQLFDLLFLLVLRLLLFALLVPIISDGGSSVLDQQIQNLVFRLLTSPVRGSLSTLVYIV